LNRIVLVARREYRQITATRGFWVMLLFIPLAIIVTQIAAQLIKPPASIAYVIVDASGQYARTVQRRIELDYQRTVPRPIVLAQVPGTVPTSQGSERFGAAIAPLLQGEIATPDGKRPLALAIYIPKDFGARGIPVRIWTDGRPHDALIETVRSALTNALRFQVLRTSGLSDAVFTRIAALNAPLAITTPSQGSGRQLVIVRSFLPLALVYILLMTVLVTGSLMLQGAIEERSNKLLEAVLACISPNALMYGKLLGLGAIGLTTVVVWTATAVGAGLATHGVVADFLRSSFASLDRPWIAVALIFYFLAGYLVVSMIYLAIGSLSDSMQDAQAYLLPVVIMIMLPVVFMMGVVVQNPDGLLPRIMSWIPLYTAFAMLARLGSGVPWTEVLGTGLMLTVFVVAEVILLGRLFRASLLRAGQPPKLGALLGLMLRASEN
jgi:ABC-2 type transport system permease protein